MTPEERALRVLSWIRSDTVSSEVEPDNDRRESLLRESLLQRTATAISEAVAEETERCLAVPEVWTEEETDGMVRAFENSYGPHGLRESLFAVGAFLLRHRAAAIRAPREGE